MSLQFHSALKVVIDSGARGSSRGGIVTRCVGRPEPVPGDDAEVAGAAAGVRPPELAIRVGRSPASPPRLRASALVHGDHLDGVADSPPRDRAAGRGSRTRRRPRARPCRSPDIRRAGSTTPQFSNSARNVSPTVAPASTAIARLLRVVVDALHRRDVDDHPHVGIRYEALEAVPAARHDEPPPFLDAPPARPPRLRRSSRRAGRSPGSRGTAC